MNAIQDTKWLLLIHQIPPKPDYLRVKIWRRLQKLGAVAIKNTVYVLPSTPESLENFQWIVLEITDGNGDATLCEASFIDGLTDFEVVGLFNDARNADYLQIVSDIKQLAEKIDALGRQETAEGHEQTLARMNRRLSEVKSVDFFEADGYALADGALQDIENRIQNPAPHSVAAHVVETAALKGRTWVTRKGLFIDRIASGWLIQRFIDPESKFKYVPEKGYKPLEGELRFDMYEGEFTHKGDACTFEMLVNSLNFSDPALRHVAEIVHDIDLQDRKFGRDEAPGIESIISGIALSTQDDDQRMERGMTLFDGLLEHFRNRSNRRSRRKGSQ